MAKVITITSGKGGVGKTTVTANIGVALAALGKRVVCLDADIGLRNLDVVMGLENRIVYDIVDVIEGLLSSQPTWCACVTSCAPITTLC
jgi:septum site-determining protein MinD